MKKNLPTLFICSIFRIAVVLGAFATDVRAQCSASIPSATQTICMGTSLSIPVTLSGTAPFTFSYQINGVPQAPVTSPVEEYVLGIDGIVQSSVVALNAMTDGTGCQGTVSGAVTVQVSPPMTLFDNQIPVTCNSGNDGAIQITVNGGVAPYYFAWSTGATSLSQLEGLGEGTYTVTVTDANGCTAARSSTLLLQYPDFTYQVTPANCNLANGAINVELTSPTAFNVWANGAGSTEDLTNIPAGTYIMVATESTTGCIKTATITVPEVSNISITPTITPVSCFGEADGSATVVASGGFAPYTYLWSNGSTLNLSNVQAGNYNLTVTDATGCTQVATVTIPQGTVIGIHPVVQQPTCGNSDGAIDISITGGTAPYQVQWSNGSNQEDLVNISGGSYTVTVTDAGGCSGTLVRSIGTIALSAQITFAQCLGNINLSVAGGAPPYAYLWSNNETSEDISGVPAGNYSVTVADGSGCTAVQSVNVGTAAQVSASIVHYAGACSGALTALVGGAPASDATFLWSNGQTNSSITNVPAGTYTVTVTASTGCSGTASITVLEPVTNGLITLSVVGQQVACFGAFTGAVNVTVTGVAPPFSFLWSNGATTEDIANVGFGAYFVTVTDANGCSKIGFQNITQPQALTVSWQVVPEHCNGSNSGGINLSVQGGVLPYLYAWRNQSNELISNTQDLNNIPGGVYTVYITDANGCMYTSPDIQVQSTTFSVVAHLLSAQCNSAALTVDVSGGTAPFEYEWAGPGGFNVHTIGPNVTVSLSGTYTATVVDANGCMQQSSVEVSLAGAGNCGVISGRVVHDEQENCQVDPNEPGLNGWLVRAESPSDTFYGVSDAQGNYWVQAPAGTYTMAAIPLNALWQACPSGPAVTINAPNDTIYGNDLPVQPFYDCPSLSVFIGTNMLRRCFDNNYYYVTYCNEGTTPAENAFILLTLDPLILPLNASVPYTNLGGGVLKFDIGGIAVGACGTFYLRVQVSCAAVFGQTHCTEAHIYPDGNCLPTDPQWSGASLRVSSQCTQDSVRFTIQNIGTGDMPESANYIVVEDAVMLMEAPFQLASGASSVVAVPANGSTWRIEVDQAPFHPGLSAPALSVEGCTTTASFSTGYVSQFAADDADPWIDIDCTQNIGSFDPNDKQGFPVGYGTEHYIRPGTELEYLIRFQNTGTDTAFTVRIVDTLFLWLDPVTIRPGVSSHPYQFNFTDHGIAEFLFENILLPDSNVNLAGSSGFVKFSIFPRADAPLETLIENDAAIYFDFNDPVITNTTRHRLGENFMSVGLWQPQRPEYRVSVSPNPFSASARLEVKGLESALPVHLQVFDLQGNVVHDETSAGPVLELRKGSLPTGLYLFRLDQKGVLIGNGKLMVKE